MVDRNSFLQAPLHHVWVMGSSLTCENNSHITFSPLLRFLLLLPVELVQKHWSWTRMEETETPFSKESYGSSTRLVEVPAGERPDCASPAVLCHFLPFYWGQDALQHNSTWFYRTGERLKPHLCCGPCPNPRRPLEEKKSSQEYSEPNSQINKQLTVKAVGINNTVLSTG